MPKRDEILRDALSLPQEDRAELADEILQSLDEADQDEVDARWAWEAEDRISAFDRGEIQAIPGEEVFSSLKPRQRA